MANDRIGPPVSLPLMVRAFPEQTETPDRPGSRGAHSEPQWPDFVLILDTETTTDPAQRLLFGSYQFDEWVSGDLRPTEEGLFHADDLEAFDSEGYSVLRSYARTHDLDLLTRRDFVDRVLWKAGYQARCLVVGFNLPFDLSRLAVSSGPARGKDKGGFSLALWDYWDENEQLWSENKFRPRITIKNLDSKRAFIGFKGGRDIPRSERTRGRFLDLRTFAFALTSRGYSLSRACSAFGVVEGKSYTEEHGVIRPEYIEYNRQDVAATRHLLVKLRAEFEQYPIDLDPCKAYSPASIAKACLRRMGVSAPIRRFDAVPQRVHGLSMCTYFGGRAEARVRRVLTPVVTTDFLSMYPTVNALMHMWRLVTAETLEVVDETERVRELLSRLTLDQCFDPECWREFRFLAEIEPDQDILPVRACYDGQNRNIGVNCLSADRTLWYAGPDLIASTLLTGKPPRIKKALGLRPTGTAADLEPIGLGLGVSIDPREEDFFRKVIELRKSLPRRDIPKSDAKRIGQVLKIIANSGSYGVFAEMNPESRKEAEARIHGLTEFISYSDKLEKPGEFTFPFFATLTTSGARLMLAILERCVTEYGGTYAFADTDSMAIVSTASGGIIDLAGEEVYSLSWAEVDEVRARFVRLNPYDSEIVPGSILEAEDENFSDGIQRQIYAWVISAKRYCLVAENSDGRSIVKCSEHGLGHLLNPTNPDSEDREWIRQAWEWLIATELGDLAPAPEWFDLPALTRITTSSPILLRPFSNMSGAKRYDDRIKPFNFVLSASVAEFGYPTESDPTRFHLIAPYEADPSKWLELDWVDRYSGQVVPVTTNCPAPAHFARLKSYQDVLELFRVRPESKSASGDGTPCIRDTRGLLQRRHIICDSVAHIGKESHRLEDVEKGLIHDPMEVTISYESDEWESVVPRLHEFTASRLANVAGVTPDYIKMIRNGRRTTPSARVKGALMRFVRRN